MANPYYPGYGYPAYPQQPEVSQEEPIEGQAVRPFLEGQREVPEWDSLRWGDGDIIAGAVPAALVGGAFVIAGKQMVRAHHPRPVVWAVQVNVDEGVQFPAGEVNPITVVFEVTIGCGQSRTTITLSIVLTAANGYQVPPGGAPPPMNLPAGDIQVKARVQWTPTVLGAFQFRVASMVAPWGQEGGEGSRR